MILKWQTSVIVWIVMSLDNNHLNRLFPNCFSLPYETIFLCSILDISRLVTFKCTYYHCISYQQLLGLCCIVSRVCLCIYFDMYVVPCNWSCFLYILASIQYLAIDLAFLYILASIRYLAISTLQKEIKGSGLYQAGKGRLNWSSDVF